MAISDYTRIALVPAAADVGKEKRMTWRKFQDENGHLEPEDLAAIATAIESGNAFEYWPGKGAIVVYIVRRS